MWQEVVVQNPTMTASFARKVYSALFLWALPFLFSLFMAFAASWAMGDHTSEGLRGAYYMVGVLMPVLYVLGAVISAVYPRTRLPIPLGLLAMQALYFLVDFWY